MAEDAARELSNLSLEDALQLVHLYFEQSSLKAEPAARRWLVRYLNEGTPSLRDVAKVTASLENAPRASDASRAIYPQGRLRFFERVPVRVARILEEDRGVTIPVPDREASNFNLVIPVFAEQEGTNVGR